MAAVKADIAFEDLKVRVRTLPVPAAPPRYPSVGSSIGIGLLNAALNLDHLSRVSERLALVDRTHLDRHVAIHVSLDRLTPDQYLAAANYGRLRQRTNLRTTLDPLPGDSVPLVWVPIDRLNRSIVAPLPLRDNEGREVARATQPELLPVINAAMYVLLRTELQNDPEAGASQSPTDLHELVHRSNRARWLIEHAITDMIYSRAMRSPSAGADSSTTSLLRDAALRVLDTYINPGRHSAFFDLLWHASNEYLVVVGLTPSKEEHYITYRAPTLPTSGKSVVNHGVRRLLRGVCPGREFTFVYKSSLPRNLHSYHVTIETDSGVHIREAILTTESEAPHVSELRADLQALADEIDRPPDVLSAPYVAYEVSDAAFRLAGVAANRERDVRVYDEYTVAGRKLEAKRSKAVQDLSELAREVKQLRDERGPLDVSWMDMAERLQGYSARAKSLELHRDLVVDDDPRENGAHMYWRRARVDGSAVTSTKAAHAHVVLADDPPSLSGGIAPWLAVLAILVISMGYLLYDDFDWLWPWNDADSVTGQNWQADALVGVLLIVPGVVLARLRLPQTVSVAGQLNFLDRVIAQAAVIMAGAIGLTLAARSPDDDAVHIGFWIGSDFLILLFGIAMLDRLISWYRRKKNRAMLINCPAWMRPDAGWVEKLRRRTRDRLFDSSDREADAIFESLRGDEDV